MSWTYCSFAYDHFQKMRQLARGEGKIVLLLIFVVLGYPVGRLAARALKSTYCSIEMYWKGALPLVKMYPSWNARAFHAYFRFTWKGLFRRSPRSISTSRKFWKASEYRSWLLFYSLPIAGPYLPAEYAHHYSLLVYTVHILLGSSILPHDLTIANELLLCFYQHMPELYEDTSCLINVHNLIHLAPLVKQWGPLWVYSCFGFESMNGHLKKMFHGTRQILGQLVFSVKAQQSLSFQCKFLNGENRTTMDFIQQYAAQHPKVSSSGVVFLGGRKRDPLSTECWLST